MSSAICFNLDQSKILLSGNGLKNRLYRTYRLIWDLQCHHCSLQSDLLFTLSAKPPCIPHIIFLFQSKIGSIIQQEQEAAKQLTTVTVAPSPDSLDDKSWDADDFEQLFSAVVNAQDGDRSISEPFHLLPYKTVSIKSELTYDVSLTINTHPLHPLKHTHPPPPSPNSSIFSNKERQSLHCYIYL